MLAPAEEQSAVAPFFDRSRPVLGSLRASLSDRPIPRSHAAVTILLPAMPQLATVPTNSNGTAPSALASAAHAATGPTIPSAPATKKLPTTVLCPIDFKRNIRCSLIFSSSLSILRLSEPHALSASRFVGCWQIRQKRRAVKGIGKLNALFRQLSNDRKSICR